jgi:peptide/nickel transport system substrate-binding protein
MRRGVVAVAMVFVVLSGCGPSGPGDSTSGTAQRSAGPKRIILAFSRELDLAHHLGQNRPLLRALVNPGLSVVDDHMVRRPALAESVPTLENGLWKTTPDGRMETTWTIREGVRWHDGAPFTTDDLVFTATVGRDREVAILNNQAWPLVEEVTPLDERTITVRWKEPYISADQVFSAGTTTPLPRHKLEAQYLESKADFPRLTFWLYDYLGTGPFRVRSWDPSNLAALEANSDYVLGRPKIDEIEVRFILDGNTLTASVLAGAIDIVTNLGSVDRAITVRDSWPDGQVVFQFDQGGGPWLHPQFVNPRPAVIAELQFRRALLHAIDRQGMADTLGGGIAPVAHSYLNPGQPEYREIEAQLPHYEYDPRRASQLIGGLGYTRGADGALRDQTGQQLQVEILSAPADSAANAGATVADHWQRVGIGASAVRETPRLAQNPEAEATFPGFFVGTQPKDVVGLWNLHSSRARLPQNSFQVGSGGNYSRYMNAEMDGLIDAYFRTIPVPERISALGQIILHVAEQLPVMGTYYTGQPDAFANRLVNVSPKWAGAAAGTNPAWNAHEWDVR